MRRWIPPLMILLGLAALGLYFGPDIYRNLLFKRDSRQLLSAARDGDLKAVAAQLAPSQQAGIGGLLAASVPDGYHERIDSLRLTRWWRGDTTTIWAIVKLRIDEGEAAGLHQGKLRWVYDSAARRWWWDFNNSYGAPLAFSGEPDWQRLGDLIQLAEQL